MSSTVRVGFGDYDHTRDLWNGRVSFGEGELEATPVDSPEELFSRFLDGGEWDAAELSLAVATARRAQGDDSLIILPVFPARAYRQSSVFVRANGIAEAAELNGARIGIPVWAQTAGIYARGVLASDHGVDLRSVRWVQGGVDEPGRKEPVDLDLDGFDIRRETDRSLDDLLTSGELDAVITARPPASAQGRGAAVQRLFPKFTFDEMDYAKRSGIFPIMHVLVLRRAAYDRNPAVADELVRSFTEAKDRSLRRALSAVVPSYPLPWASANAERARGLLGDDFWPYGVEANRATLEVFLGYSADQGITATRLSIDELFTREPTGL
ncbi:hypothetical protein [Microbacterium allomyrinae]|uniref:4,5-dihydroxyphthalate decarboxylase n=1 Tax=Microbacterium allomyrinae TaxID=2830666 RepID=A0A9X1S4M5_9MICO|nr:hypothetical protein [Microbacterium allomyrinae]MCC2033253.1 hypothetical protein [Microbacterium allomyrinae]